MADHGSTARRGRVQRSFVVPQCEIRVRGMRNGSLGSVSENVQCGTLGRGPQHRGEIVTSEIAKLGRGNELSFQRSPDDEVNGALGFWFVRALAVEKAALDANLLPAAVRCSQPFCTS